MYLVVFDKRGKGLSGWHYRQLKKLGGEWIQRSVVLLGGPEEAEGLRTKLREFGVQKIVVFQVRVHYEYS